MSGDGGLPLASDGYRPILGAFSLCLLAGVGAGFFEGALAAVFAALAALFGLAGVFLTNFFRDPTRTPPGGERDVVSPADGRVLNTECGVREDRFLHQDVTKISIFMSPLDVHVNRAPVQGEISGVHYHPGEYFAAFSEKASLDNEQNAIVMRCADGREILFIQIAGFLARRIVCWVAPGDSVACGERVGMIKLGSRVDIFVPGGFKLNVKPGDRVRAGESVLGELE